MNGFIKRVYFVYVILIIITVMIIWKIIFLQYFANIKITDSDISFRQEEIEANRGSILARDGRPLSTSVPYFQMRMDCIVPEESVFNTGVDALSLALSGFFKDKSSSEYKKELVTARRERKRYKTIGNRLVDYTEMLQIREFPIFSLGANRGGIIAEQRNKRNNPYGRLAYRTIGFINSQGVGVGIEGSYDFYLKGKPGRQTVQRMLGGEWVPVSSEEILLPSDGSDILTTIDIDIQEATESALREQLSLSDVFEGATAIVMEVKTGAIRAIANMKKDIGGEFDESYNYAIGHATEPGSTFKLATLVALIEDGYVTLDTPVDAGDGRWTYSTYTYSDAGNVGYGMINVQKAFEKSSNVSFAKLAVEYYANNEKKYIDRIMNMKLNEKFGLDIMGEARAVIYTPGDNMWSKLTIPSMSIGYASLLTPLHTLTFYNAIANNGKMMKPYFVENLQKTGVILQKFGPQEVSGAICSKKTIEQVKIALRGVVEHGTGKSINDKRYTISGKTGTARIAFDGKYIDSQGNRKHQASFAGFFPSENPKYSAIVVIYTNKTKENFYGGSWAAPIFKQIADKIYSTSPQWNDPIGPNPEIEKDSVYILAGNGKAIKDALSRLTLPKGVMVASGEWLTRDTIGYNLKEYEVITDSIPDVSHMGLKDALYLLENLGYRVKFSGRGRIVAQSPAAGSSLSKNGLIELILSDENINK
ncbi:MAG: penicillin-binding protein [Bacteroidales bacterium]|nr:penicillin-binding protein [Bacteroidales bacterium]